MAPNIPALAETLFQALCDEHNVTRNKAVHDRTGWDYLIEIDPPYAPTVPTDQQPSSVSARVQIKSRKGGRPSVKVKLTNALRFAKEPQPCFLVLYHFRNEEHPVSVYARHFDDDLIEKALRRARQADAEGEAHLLHHIEMTIGLSEKDEHTNDLMQWILGICSVDPLEYTSRKRETERRVGYDGKLWSGTVEIEAGQLPKLIDYAVGLQDSPPPVLAKLHNWRFDIMSPRPVIDGMQDITGYKVPAEPGKIFFKGRRCAAEFEGSIKHILISDDLQSVVFDSDDLRFTLSGLQAEIELRSNQKNTKSLRQLRKILSYVNVLDHSFRLQLWASGKKIMQCPLPAHPISNQPQADWALRVLNALIIIDRENVDPELSADCLFDEASVLDELLEWLSNPRVSLSRHLGTARQSRVVGQASYVQARLGKSVFWAVLRRPVLHENFNRGVQHLVLGRAALVDAFVVASTRLRSASLARRFAHAVTLCGPGTLVIGDGRVVTEAGAAWSITGSEWTSQ